MREMFRQIVIIILPSSSIAPQHICWGFSFAQKEKIMETKQSTKIRTVTGTAMLTAVAVGLQYIEISIPIMPSFVKLDFSDLENVEGGTVKDFKDDEHLKSEGGNVGVGCVC